MARSTKSVTAGTPPNRRPQAHGPSPAPPREAAETPAHRARAAAPGWWQGRTRPGLSAKSAAMSGATASTRSQLSRTSRSRLDARNVASVSRKGWPETSRTPSAAAMVGRTSVGSIQWGEIDEDDPVGEQLAHPHRDPDRETRFPPTHLGPVRVTNRSASLVSLARSAVSSASRPMSRVSGTGNDVEAVGGCPASLGEQGPAGPRPARRSGRPRPRPAPPPASSRFRAAVRGEPPAQDR